MKQTERTLYEGAESEYITELSRAMPVCNETDPNFKDLGYNITEYDLQNSSGVLQ